VPRGVGEGRGTRLRADGRDGEALLGRAVAPRCELGAPDPRRLRLHGRVRNLALLPRPEDPRDRRGHERGAADGDRAAPGPPHVTYSLTQLVDEDLGCASYLIS